MRLAPFVAVLMVAIIGAAVVVVQAVGAVVSAIEEAAADLP